MNLQIDRMEIDDVGGNPSKLANAIINQLTDLERPIPVREIAAAIGIDEIREAELDGLEGALLVPENKLFGKILLNVDRPEVKKRFTVAHEIGHYVNPFHVSNSPDGFKCTAKDMVVEAFQPNDKAAKMEAEANQFAAELLMPTKFMRLFMKGKADVDICHLISLADRFNVSREAAGRRYISFLDEPTAIVFSKNGVIRYVKKSDNFPRLSVRGGQSIPQNSLAHRSRNDVSDPTSWEEVNGYIWLEKSKNVTLLEQTLAQQNGFRITLLSCELDEYEEEIEEPRFRRYSPTFST